MRYKRKSNYKKVFKRISKLITWVFTKKKIIKRHIKKWNKYILFIKNVFKRPNKLKKAKLFISASVLFFIIITTISFLIKNISTQDIHPDINYDFRHWSASTWRDFLFEGETWHDSNLTVNNQSGLTQNLYTWVINPDNTWSNNGSWKLIKAVNSWTTTTSWSTGRDPTPQNATAIWDNTWYTNNTSETIDNNTIILPKEISQYLIRKLREQQRQQQLLLDKVKSDCTTPRNTAVKNWEFIIAYTQRTDVNNVCNAEKRYCNDWILEWTFSQVKCDENTKYEYQEAPVKSQTQKPTNSYIQPSEAKNNSANFSINWKINEQTTTNTNREYSKWWAQIVSSKETWLKYVADDSDCKDPRWNNLKNWQFVTAYKTPVGFIDLECKSEFRYCYAGKLWGSFPYKECNYKDITYNDYLAWNTDTDKATTLDLMESISPEKATKSESIRKRIQSLFR